MINLDERRDEVMAVAQENGWELKRDLGWSLAFERPAGRSEESVRVFFSEAQSRRKRQVTGGSYVAPTGDVTVEDKPVFLFKDIAGVHKIDQVIDFLEQPALAADPEINARIKKMGLTPVLPDKED